jgi:hypothetical protein
VGAGAAWLQAWTIGSAAATVIHFRSIRRFAGIVSIVILLEFKIGRMRGGYVAFRKALSSNVTSCLYTP